MIELTKLNNQKIVINSDLIEFVEAVPDTTITLTTGNRVVVKETVDELVDKVIGFRQKFNLYLQNKKEDKE